MSDKVWQVSQGEGEPHKITLIHMPLTHLFQNPLVEELLQFLIAVIDTELFEAVVLKIL